MRLDDPEGPGARFEPAFEWLMQDEGSEYVNDPLDRGGPTRWGITQASLAVWRRRPVTAADVAALTRDDAKDFYAYHYWGPLRLGELRHQAVANAMLSFAVLTGPSRAVRYAQEAAGAKVDGQLGPKTLLAINSTHPARLLGRLVARMNLFFVSLVEARPDQLKWLRGWLLRSQRLLLAAVA